jgi:ABC-type Fe3+ transport system substrate-binding protein
MMPALPHSNLIRLSSLALRFSLLLAILFLSSCGKQESPEIPRLIIISPHNSDIRREFETAFSSYHLKKYGTPVQIDWPDVGSGGTSNILRQLLAAYDRGDSSGYDVVFGGGSYTFNLLASQKDAKGRNLLVKLPPLPPGEKDPLDNVPAELFGNSLHGPDNVWVAATMSRFGFIINKQRIAELNQPAPRRWEDLANPQFFGHLSLADPAKSGSIRTSYEQIFQTYGWEKGWAIITEMFANTAIIREGGSNPADDVGNADAVAGVVIDFYGRLQVSRAGERIAEFVLPAGAAGEPGGGSVLDPDPIALLRGAPNEKLAAEFIRFVVSPEGQRIWVLRAGTEGGPKLTPLGRLSILPSIYQSEGDKLLDAADPFAASNALKVNAAEQNNRSRYIGDLIKAAFIDNRDALLRVRQALHAAGDPPDLLQQLTAIPPYRTSQLQGDKLNYSKDLPLTKESLAALNTEFAPPKSDLRAPYTERIQSDTRAYWQAAFARRFADIEKAARVRTK